MYLMFFFVYFCYYYYNYLQIIIYILRKYKIKTKPKIALRLRTLFARSFSDEREVVQKIKVLFVYAVVLFICRKERFLL